MVLEGRSMHKTHDDDSLDRHEKSFFSLRSLHVDIQNEVEDMHAIQSNHDEGIWENIAS